MSGARCVAHGRMRGRAALERVLRARGIPAAWTEAPGGLTALCEAALAQGCTRLLVAGGDGTLGEAAGVLRGTGVPLGVIPGGTGNDFARMLAIPAEPAAAVALALEGPVRSVDLGHARFVHAGAAAERAFLNIAEVGLGARAVAEVQRVGKKLGPRLAYPAGILTGLALYRPAPVELRCDGERKDVARLTNLVVANGRFFGRGLQPAPHAVLDDGLLDVLLMRDLRALEMLRRLRQLQHGPPEGDARLTSWRARTIEVSGPSHLLVEADGEVLGTLPATFAVLPAALRVVTSRTWSAAKPPLA